MAVVPPWRVSQGFGDAAGVCSVKARARSTTALRRRAYAKRGCRETGGGRCCPWEVLLDDCWRAHVAARRTVLCAAKWQRTAQLVRRRSGIGGNSRMDVLQRPADGVGPELGDEEEGAGKPRGGSWRSAGRRTAAGPRAGRSRKRVGCRKAGSSAQRPRPVTVASRIRRQVVACRSGACRHSAARGLRTCRDSGALGLRKDQ